MDRDLCSDFVASRHSLMEAVMVSVQTVKVMKEGAKVQKREIKKLGGVDAVENAEDEMQDGIEVMNEINEALGGGSSINLADEEALEAMMVAVRSYSPPPPLASSRRPYSIVLVLPIDSPCDYRTWGILRLIQGTRT
jgi:hypothetical protein